MITIPYEPDGDPNVRFKGSDVRLARLKAGYSCEEAFGDACGLSKNKVHRIESGAIKKVPMSLMCKMIRVCNGSE